MIRVYGRANGFAGLSNTDGNCACTWDDLATCGAESFECELGFESPCDCGDHDFHIETPKLDDDIKSNPTEIEIEALADDEIKELAEHLFGAEPLNDEQLEDDDRKKARTL